MGKSTKKAKHPVGHWFARTGQPGWGAGIVRGVDHVGDSFAEFPAGALHNCGQDHDGRERIRMGFGEWLFHDDNYSRKATKGEIAEAKALFEKQGIDWTTGKAKPTKPAPKAKWKPRTIEIPSKATRPVLVDLVHECVAEINQLGAENARLKNQITKLKGAKA